MPIIREISARRFATRHFAGETSIFHPEDRARIAIDAQLAEAGWVVQSRDEMNLGAGTGIAVREFSTATGPVDYALFVERTLCGVVEAKAEGATLSGYSDQAGRYMAGVPEHLVRREGQVRFEYVASGTEILFRDHADPVPRSRRVFFFHRPETLRRWLTAPITIRTRLQTMPPLVTTDLRDCQIESVTELEKSLAADKPRALIQAATGAGKTFTACAFSYRLLEHAKFRRILFLADRANLVRQARDEFMAYRPPGSGRSFTELYSVQRLGPAGLDKDAAVVIATIQRVYSMLSGRELSEEEEEQSAFETWSSDVERVVRYNPMVPIIREVFGKGNDFAKKITYRTDAGDPEQLIRQFRNDYNPRIAVTVDMIATGTDVKALEVLIFLRDVKSEQYYDQMKGRGVRTISPTQLRQVTPDAEDKSRFVLVDAVGVTESLKHVSQPLERNRVISFDRLLDDIAAGRRDEDALSTLAGRLAALDRKIDENARAAIAKATSGLEPKTLAHKLLDAIDPDTIEREAIARHGTTASDREREVVTTALKEEACRVFDDPALRQLLKDVKRATQIRIDTISTDTVVSSGYDEARAQDTTGRFRRFLDEQRDTLIALQILYGRPQAARRLDRVAIEELRDAMRRPPWLLEPVDIWRAYKRLDDERVHGNPTRALSDIIMLIRFALGQSTSLEPLSATIAGRFNLWLGREERAGRTYTEAQRAWLFAIRDFIAFNISITPDDLQDAPDFAAQGGVARAHALFGDRLKPLLDELPEVLIA